MRKVKIIEVPCDMGAGERGASLGVEAIRYEAVIQQNKGYLQTPYSKVLADNSAMNFPDPTPNAHYLDGILSFYKETSSHVAEELKSGGFPLVVAGDHSTAGATIAGIKKANPDKRLGVIWVDAHADIHSPYTTPSGNVHGMPLAAALHFDNREEQKNTLSDEEEHLWSELKNVGVPGPKIIAKDIVYIGVRDTEAQEDALLERLNITNIKVAQARDLGMAATAEKALTILADCDIIYLSFDVDSMDPSVSTGTGTPVPEGFMEDESILLLQNILKDTRVMGMEIVEVNPMLDEKNKMAKAALRILSAVFNWS